MDEHTKADHNPEESFSAFSFKMVLPMVAVVTFVMVISCAFCCYLARLRKKNRKVGGYKKVTMNKGKENPLQETKNDMCPVCLADFKNKEVLAICPCRHVFHKKCLCKWLVQRPLCPMCMTKISVNHHHKTICVAGTSTTPFANPSSTGTASGIFPSQV